MKIYTSLICFLIAFGSGSAAGTRKQLRSDVVYNEGNQKERRYEYGYAVKQGETQFHHQRSLDGAVYGCYGFVDPQGKLFITHYLADKAGYRLVNTANPDKKLLQRIRSLGSVDDTIELQRIFPVECQADGDVKVLQETAAQMRSSINLAQSTTRNDYIDKSSSSHQYTNIHSLAHGLTSNIDSDIETRFGHQIAPETPIAANDDQFITKTLDGTVPFPSYQKSDELATEVHYHGNRKAAIDGRKISGFRSHSTSDAYFGKSSHQVNEPRFIKVKVLYDVESDAPKPTSNQMSTRLPQSIEGTPPKEADLLLKKEILAKKADMSLTSRKETIPDVITKNHESFTPKSVNAAIVDLALISEPTESPSSENTNTDTKFMAADETISDVSKESFAEGKSLPSDIQYQQNDTNSKLYQNSRVNDLNVKAVHQENVTKMSEIVTVDRETESLHPQLKSANQLYSDSIAFEHNKADPGSESIENISTTMRSTSTVDGELNHKIFDTASSANLEDHNKLSSSMDNVQESLISGSARHTDGNDNGEHDDSSDSYVSDRGSEFVINADLGYLKNIQRFDYNSLPALKKQVSKKPQVTFRGRVKYKDYAYLQTQSANIPNSMRIYMQNPGQQLSEHIELNKFATAETSSVHSGSSAETNAKNFASLPSATTESGNINSLVLDSSEAENSNPAMTNTLPEHVDASGREQILIKNSEFNAHNVNEIELTTEYLKNGTSDVLKTSSLVESSGSVSTYGETYVQSADVSTASIESETTQTSFSVETTSSTGIDGIEQITTAAVIPENGASSGSRLIPIRAFQIIENSNTNNHIMNTKPFGSSSNIIQEDQAIQVQSAQVTSESSSHTNVSPFLTNIETEGNSGSVDISTEDISPISIQGDVDSEGYVRSYSETPELDSNDKKQSNNLVKVETIKTADASFKDEDSVQSSEMEQEIKEPFEPTIKTIEDVAELSDKESSKTTQSLVSQDTIKHMQQSEKSLAESTDFRSIVNESSIKSTITEISDDIASKEKKISLNSPPRFTERSDLNVATNEMIEDVDQHMTTISKSEETTSVLRAIPAIRVPEYLELRVRNATKVKSAKQKDSTILEADEDSQRSMLPKLPATPRTTTVGDAEPISLGQLIASYENKPAMHPRPTTLYQPSISNVHYQAMATTVKPEPTGRTTVGPGGDVYDEVEEDPEPSIATTSTTRPTPISAQLSSSSNSGSGFVIQPSISSNCYEVTLQIPADAKQVLLKTESPAFRVYGQGDPYNRVKLIAPGVYEVNVGSTGGIKFQQYHSGSHKNANQLPLQLEKGFNYDELVPTPANRESIDRSDPSLNNPYLPMVTIEKARNVGDVELVTVARNNHELMDKQRALLDLVPSWKKVLLYY